jgi:hypothetical protein
MVRALADGIARANFGLCALSTSCGLKLLSALLEGDNLPTIF